MRLPATSVVFHKLGTQHSLEPVTEIRVRLLHHVGALSKWHQNNNRSTVHDAHC